MVTPAQRLADSCCSLGLREPTALVNHRRKLKTEALPKRSCSLDEDIIAIESRLNDGPLVGSIDKRVSHNHNLNRPEVGQPKAVFLELTP
jgi:hypothetical protein